MKNNTKQQALFSALLAILAIATILSVAFIFKLRLADDAGSAKAVNIVLMGHLSRYFDFTEEEWLEAIEKSVPAKFLELNKTAFTLGREA